MFMENITFTEKPKVVKRTFDETVIQTINEQRDIANGKEIKTNRTTANGEPIYKKSWYNELGGTIMIRIGIHPLFDQPIRCKSKSEFLKILDGLQNWKDDKSLVPVFKDLEKKMLENRKKRDLALKTKAISLRLFSLRMKWNGVKQASLTQY